jgi:nicotinate (nicotinamide) nucleotide adenylyltransferase
MEFFRRAEGKPERLGIFPGTFNPPTLAHLALARSARTVVDEVLFVLPRSFPHKRYLGATFNERVQMLQASAGLEPWVSIAAADGGLFLEIADEARAFYGGGVRLSFLCGSDAAERILKWDYGQPGVAEQMLRAFDLLVVSREGEYHPPRDYADRIQVLDPPGDLSHVSATEVRDRLSAGRPWEYLVPAEIVSQVSEIYHRRRT